MQRRSVDALLGDARARLVRVESGRLATEMAAGALSSSLAAATLQDLGLHRATDLVGGSQQWVRTSRPAE